jgi:hypothetical protein
MESEEISGSELGALKYVSELLDWDIKRTANLFILILIFVFDPLAITLVIATNQAFKGKRKDEDTPQVTAQVTPQVTIHDTIHDEVEIPESYLTHHTPQVTDEVPTKYRSSNGEVKKIWERVKKLQEEGKLPTPTQEDIDNEPTALAFTPYEIEDYPEKINDEDKEISQEVTQQPRRLSYLNRNNNDGKSIRINRF